ncbi:hypothetical protein K449DRAFT_438449 [Hypoxylon sp. EC38]|nr:hypothetical protein K449DRAFT_438449 [Hypoxylon sp. EC38]
MVTPFLIESLAGTPLELPNASLQWWEQTTGVLRWATGGSRGAKHRNPILPAFASPSSSQPSCSLMAGFPVSPLFPCTSPQNFLSAELVALNDILSVIVQLPTCLLRSILTHYGPPKLILSSSSSFSFSFSIPQRRTRTRNGGGEDSVRLRAFAVCPSNPAPLVLPLLYILRYADVHLPPTYLRFPLAAPRYHIHGANKTYTPPPLPKPDPSICFLASLQTCHPIAAAQSDGRVVSIARPFTFCRLLQQGFF